ncbi:MAG: PA domain-containing protein [Ilumatobacter sp.]|uniref:LVIVD repeat-containing protein n=1 Tax=Ilumatobacter sp. TaxID=1967498 RepID=UPI003C768EDA
MLLTSRTSRLRAPSRRRAIGAFAAIALATSALAAGTSSAHDELDDGFDEGELSLPEDPSADLAASDNSSDVVSGAPFSKVTKNLDVVGRGVRNVGDATTDVWAYGGYAYTGTFNEPCGGDPEAGIWIWNVKNKNKPSFVDVIQSPEGSRTNDVRVDGMNSGDVLVHSNESCAGGPGGFEIYDVDDPKNPVPLASVRIDDPNPLAPDIFGPIEDVGVHNLFLFTQGDRDYVGVTTETAFGNFHIYDITDPAAPVLQSFFGAEEVFDPGVVASGDFGRNLDAAVWLTDGFGASANRFLHDVTVSDDGTEAYLANWDAGLILLDISDTTDPQVISVALDEENGSLDGEVNSHSVWPSADGSIVVEGEEDFSAWEGSIPPSGLTLDGTATPGDPTIPATAAATEAGDFFEANQVGLTGSTDGTSIVVDGGPTFAASELSTAAGSPTFADIGTITGNLVYIGRACTLTQEDTLLNADSLNPGDIAIVRRGACEFQEKADAAAAAGAAAVVITNNQPSTPWSGLRIWDYSDPSNPTLASTFNTTCSASTAPSDECAANGTYSAHNVVVENKGNKVLAYVSWYWDGMLVLDVTDPYNPIEIARYLDTSGPNDGLANDFWGVYKEAKSPFIYGSDRNGGLYVFKLKGSGSK